MNSVVFTPMLSEWLDEWLELLEAKQDRLLQKLEEKLVRFKLIRHQALLQ